MRKLRGHITAEEALDLWHADEESSSKKDVLDPMKQKYRCMQCALSHKPFNKRPEDFGIYKSSDLMPKLFMDGMWTRCQECQDLQAGPPYFLMF